MGETEVWTTIAERPGCLVSNVGNVRGPSGVVLKPYLTPGGYLRITLYKFGVKPVKKLIHRLVATAYVPNPEGKALVNHIDGDRKNNVHSNLEWMTNKENSNARKFPAKTRMGRPVVQLSAEGKTLKVWNSALQAAKALDLIPSSIGHCCRGQIKKTGGTAWAYLDKFEPKRKGEVWKPWSYGNRHLAVSSHGRIRTERDSVIYGSNSIGYLRFNGQAIHRTVATAFPEHCPRREGCDFVNHKDGNKTNNAAANLEWVSSSENSQHAINTGLNPKRRPVKCLKTNCVYVSMAEAERQTGACVASISKSCRSNYRVAGGSRWKYVTAPPASKPPAFSAAEMDEFIVELLGLGGGAMADPKRHAAARFLAGD